MTVNDGCFGNVVGNGKIFRSTYGKPERRRRKTMLQLNMRHESVGSKRD